MSAYNINLNIKAANQTGAAFKGARSNMQGLQQQQFAAVKSSKMFQRSIQQAGMQVSDFAVQVGGGQSAILAFTQNAPQFVQSFGAIGGAIAAVISIGGVLALVWSRSRDGMKSTSKLLKELADAMGIVRSASSSAIGDIDKLTSSYGRMAGAAKRALVALRNVAIIKGTEKLQSVSKRLSEAADTMFGSSGMKNIAMNASNLKLYEANLRAVSVEYGRLREFGRLATEAELQLSTAKMKAAISSVSQAKLAQELMAGLADANKIAVGDVEKLSLALTNVNLAKGPEAQTKAMSEMSAVLESIWPTFQQMPIPVREMYEQLNEAIDAGSSLQSVIDTVNDGFGSSAPKVGEVTRMMLDEDEAMAVMVEKNTEMLALEEKRIRQIAGPLMRALALEDFAMAQIVAKSAETLAIDRQRASVIEGMAMTSLKVRFGNDEDLAMAMSFEIDKGNLPDKPKKKDGSGGKPDVENLKEAYDSLLGSLSPAIQASQDFAKAQNTINSAMRAGVITAADAGTAMEMLKYSTSELKDVMGTVESSMSSAFMSMVDGTKTAADAFRDMARDIIKKLYDILVVQRLVGSFDGKTGTGLAGIIGGWMSGGGMFGNFTNVSGVRANGGGISAGSPYIVGERGPELIIPGRSGTVIPNSNLGGGGGNVTINNTFTGGVTRADLGEMIPKIVEASKRAVLDARKRGGSYAAGFGG